jgi:hypothetical protein
MGVYAAAAQAALQIGQAEANATMTRIQSGFQATQQEQDAKLALMQAEEIERVGEEQATESRKQGKQVIGEQRAIQGASGIEVNSGSALDVQGDTAALAELDALTIKNNAFRESLGFKIQSDRLKNQAQLTRKFGKAGANLTALGGGLAAAGTVGSAFASRGA